MPNQPSVTGPGSQPRMGGNLRSLWDPSTDQPVNAGPCKIPKQTRGTLDHRALFAGSRWERQARICLRQAHLLTGTRRALTACTRLMASEGAVLPASNSGCAPGALRYPQLSGGSLHCSEMELGSSHTAYVGSGAEWTDHRPREPGVFKARGVGALLSPLHVLWSIPWGSTCLSTPSPGPLEKGEHSPGGK